MSTEAVLRRLEIVDELRELAKDLQTAKRLGLIETIDYQTTTGKRPEVDMSGEAISRRIREVSELNQLGRSLLKAKPLPAFEAPQTECDQSKNDDSTAE